MTSLELAITFPEAKAVLERLCREDVEKIKDYNDRRKEIRNTLMTDIRTVPYVDDYEEMLSILWLDRRKQHFRNNKRLTKGWRDIITADERLAKNREVLRLMKAVKKGGTTDEDWAAAISEAKAYPIDRLLEVRRDGKGKCLWHDDRRPSLHYYRKTNSVYCFACNKYGDAIDIAMAIMNIDFQEAITWLRSNS